VRPQLYGRLYRNRPSFTVQGLLSAISANQSDGNYILIDWGATLQMQLPADARFEALNLGDWEANAAGDLGR